MIKMIAVFLITVFFAFSSSVGQEVISLKSQREIFVDNYLIAQKENVELALHTPKKEGPVLALDKPWEGPISNYTTIIKDGDLYRAYYRGLNEAGKDYSATEVTCYAESNDGIHWSKPNLRIHEVHGTLDNNVILANAAPVTHNFCPFLDTNPKVDSKQKYKAIGGNIRSGLIAYVSEDGIHWEKLRTAPVITEGKFDSQNVAFWSQSERKYICYFRTTNNGFRSVSRTTSTDFINWTDPVVMEFGDTPLEHLYTQQTSPYYRAPHIYVAIGARFMPNRQVVSDAQAKALNVNPKYYKDCSDAVFITSRGGNAYDRTFMESFIRPGIGLENWVSRTNYPALNVVQTGDTEMSVYVNEDYAQPTAHITRYSMRIDGFTSLSADYAGGELVTKPFNFEGEELEINYATSAAGSIKIEIQDAEGNPVPGFTLKDSQEIIGNEIKRIVSWNENTDVSELSSKPIRLKLYLKDADLYSLRFN